ncbi:MAG: AbrB/MazE/SpoVT family DNA-binding domain-containing protein [Candidatus Dormibacteria bacterium]
MADSEITRLFMSGTNQAVPLPRQFRLEPLPDVDAWFQEIDAVGSGDFMPEGRQQPDAPPSRALD